MEYISFLIVVIVIISVVSFVLKTISLKEYAWIVGIAIAITCASMLFDNALHDISAGDYELWNGSITSKYPKKEDCPRGWRDYRDSFCTEYTTRVVENGQICSTDDKGNTSCVTNYKTQYKYNYAWEQRWFVHSENLGHVWEFARIDGQGKFTPPEWDAVQIGEPASITNHYKNWIVAASDSIFHNDGIHEEKYSELIPKYPINIYDRWKVDRLITVEMDIDPEFRKKINRKISDVLISLGPKRQMNAIVMAVNSSKADINYAYAVRRAWKGFKKNDAVVFIGTDGDNVQWVEVLSWSKNAEFNVELRDTIAINKKFDLEFVVDQLYKIGMEKYERRSMKEFEFLKDDIPFNWTMFSIMIIAQIISGAVTINFFHKNDIG